MFANAINQLNPLNKTNKKDKKGAKIFPSNYNTFHLNICFHSPRTNALQALQFILALLGRQVATAIL